MRPNLLITTAIAGLLAGTFVAAAQNMPKQGGADGGAQQAPTQRGPDASEPGQGKQGQPQGKQGQRENGKKGGAQTTGQGGSQNPQGQSDEGNRGKRDQNKQGQRENGKQGEQGQGRGQTEQGAQQGQQGAQQGGQQRQQDGRQSTTEGKASFTPEQRTRIRERVIARGPHARNINISLNVGVVVPASVEIVVVPEEIVEVYPNYRGYFYFVYNDEIIIVDRAHKVVAVIVI
jgi:hypothetical protein